MYWELIAKFNLLKFRFSVDIFGTEECKVTFGLKYICSFLFNFTEDHMLDKFMFVLNM